MTGSDDREGETGVSWELEKEVPAKYVGDDRWNNKPYSKRNEQTLHPLGTVFFGRSPVQRELGCSSGEDEEQRNDPDRKEGLDGIHGQRGLDVLDVKLTRREDDCAVQSDDREDGHHPQPINIISSFNLVRSRRRLQRCGRLFVFNRFHWGHLLLNMPRRVRSRPAQKFLMIG